MKKMLWRRLVSILAIGMLCSLALSYFLQIRRVQADTDVSTRWMFWQTHQVLLDNKREYELVKADFYNQCLSKARAAAYMVERSSMDINDSQEMAHIADLLDVDELHVFDADGTIVAGSEPKYFGLNFNSGEQMQFFLPMLEDKSLELCQDVTPNTAEAKMMQYAAVWRQDGEGIIQIGMEPHRLLDATERFELSYVFPLVSELEGTDVCAADPESFEILASTNQTQFAGKTLLDLGFQEEQLAPTEKSFHTRVDGRIHYCMVTSMEDILVVRFYDAAKLYRQSGEMMLVVLLTLLTIFVFMMVGIFHYVDRNIIRSIAQINKKLNQIGSGELERLVEVNTTPEFAELSLHINNMVMSILSNTVKLSYVLNAVRLPIAIYEYGYGMRRVRYTSKLPEILGLEGEERERLLESCDLFSEKMAEIRQNRVDNEIYRLPGDPDRYLRIETYMSDNNFFGILVDVTADIEERRRIERERDEDLLTGLLNRRAFYTEMEELFETDLGPAALVMIDTDDLKKVNDTLGHEAGDQYLRGMADILRTCSAPHRIAARLSGDEFAILFWGCEREELDRHVSALQEMQQGVVTHFGDLPLTVRFSLGDSRFPRDGEDFYELLKLADQRMYENKRLRKGGRKRKG